MNLRHVATVMMFVFVTGAFSVCPAQESSGFVYTMTNSKINAILAFERAGNGRLSGPVSVPTGGAGTGSNLGSQGALALSEDGHWLFAVNAGSNQVSVFERRRDGLKLTDVVASGGTLPESVAVSGELVYVLNTGAPANISGFSFDDDKGTLNPIPNSIRPLSAASPGAPQIGFDRTGSLLFVTEKATNQIDSYEVQEDGTTIGPHPQNSVGLTPFGFAFDRRNRLFVTEAFGGQANKSATSSYEVDDNGVLEAIDGSVATNQTAACWIAITRNGKFAYATDTGSGAITGYRISHSGRLSLLDANGVSAPTGNGSSPVDLALTRATDFLYDINVGTGTLIGWRVQQSDGKLLFLNQVEKIPASSTGLVAQ